LGDESCDIVAMATVRGEREGERERGEEEMDEGGGSRTCVVLES
jgi:hypothetical protein